MPAGFELGSPRPRMVDVRDVLRKAGKRVDKAALSVVGQLDLLGETEERPVLLSKHHAAKLEEAFAKLRKTRGGWACEHPIRRPPQETARKKA